MLANINYKPKPSQLKAHRNPAQYRAMVGGLGSGKTTFGCREVLRWTQRFPGGVFLIGRYTSKALKNTTQRRFFEILDSVTDGKREKLVHKWLENESHLWLKTPKPGVYSEILFFHLDNPGPLGSLDLDGFWIDECHEPEGDEVPESVFNMLQARLRGKVGPLRGLVTSNSGGKDWIWRRFFSTVKDPNCWGIVVPSSENKDNLPPRYLEDLIANHDEKWVKRYIEASFDVFEGQIFEEFDLEKHVYDPTSLTLSGGYVEAGFDFGIAAPTAILMGRFLPPSKFDECQLPHVYIFSEFYKSEADIRVAAQFIKHHHPRIVWADPSVQVRSATKESPLMLYAREGVALTPAPNDVATKISTIHQFLLRERLHISKKCQFTIECVQAYQWKPQKNGEEKEKPLKANDHAVDALGYLLMGNPLGRLLDPVVPGSVTPVEKPLVTAPDGTFRHPSLDEDTDKEPELLDPDDYLIMM